MQGEKTNKNNHQREWKILCKVMTIPHLVIWTRGGKKKVFVINHGSISSSSGIINYFLSRLINNENYHDAGKWPVVIHSSLILDKKYSLELFVIVILYIVKIPVVLLNWRLGYYKYDLLHIPVCHQDWHIKHESSLFHL